MGQPGSSLFTDLGRWPGVLSTVLAGTSLSQDQARAVMAEILAGHATPAQIAGFAVALRAKGETVEEITGMVAALRDAGETVPVDPSRLVDTCGTGGAPARQRAAFNVSTIAAIVVAGAGGRVCKHGNRGASSTSGSFDLLEALGVTIDAGPEVVARCIEEAGIGAAFAPRFHPAMRHAGPPRRELGVPTVFNLLGPLANPAGVRRQVIGVSDPEVAGRMAEVLRAQGAEHAMVVAGADRLDELTTTGPTEIVEVLGGELRSWSLDASDLGLAVAAPHELTGGDASANARLARAVLAGEPGPHRDIVVLNAAAGLVVGDLAPDLAAGVAQAAEAIDSGRAATALDRLIEVSAGR
jgi:anthranilate phosphoribosyltransferase